MQGYNDFFHLTEGYLRRYNDFNTALANLQLLKKQKETELQDLKVPIAKYGTEPGGGLKPGEDVKLTQPESYAAQIIMTQEEIQELKRDIVELEVFTARLEVAMSYLNKPERDLLLQRYTYHRQWKEVSEFTGYSERQCQRMATKAAWKVCDSLFAHKMFTKKRFWFVS